MSLDMFVFKMSRLTEEELEYIRKVGKIGEVNNYLSIPEDEIHDGLYRDLERYCEKVTVDNEYIDLGKVKKDNDIPEKAYVSGASFGGGKASYSFSCGDGKARSWEVQLTQKEIEESYLKTVKESVYLVKRSLVATWAQEDELNRTICNLYDDGERYVENVGYYAVNSDMLKTMNDFESSYGEGFNEEVDSTEGLFYHIWF